MSSIKNQLLEIIDYIPEQEQFLLFEIAKRFISDDIATADDLQAIHEAQKEFAEGKTVNHNDIDWNQ